MSLIPFKACRFGAEKLNEFPVSYSKTRVSGKNQVTYILHSKGGCMPGQKDLFTPSSRMKPSLGSSLKENLITRAFILEKKISEKRPFGAKYFKDNIDSFTYDSYHPFDDSSLEKAILASYRQIFGNLMPMNSEEPIEEKRRLRNGDITIKEFIRQISKSNFYMQNFFEKVNQIQAIKLNFKHILGRPISNKNEKIKNIEVIHEHGFYGHIDYLIDSLEYNELFGNDIVPYMRYWDSPCGANTIDFQKIVSLTQGFAISDNVIINSKKTFKEISKQA